MSGAGSEIHQLSIPTPFAVGRVNCYLLSGEPLTLVDTGPNSGTALDTLELALAAHGVGVEQLELIVLTHQHMDHEGLLEILLRRSGARLAAFAGLAQWLAEFPESSAEDDLFAQAVMREHGVPEEIVTLLGVVAAAYRSNGSRGDVTLPLHDGDRLTMGAREFTVHHRPGHSPSDLIFHDEVSGLLIGGDHLLAHISSNALVSRPLGAPAHTPRGTPLLDYARSLRATRELAVTELLPGHGERISDHVTLIDERLRLQRRRAAKILALLAQGPLTAHQIALRMWGNTAVTQAYLTLSEVLGHTDMLLSEGRIATLSDGGVTSFVAL